MASTVVLASRTCSPHCLTSASTSSAKARILSGFISLTLAPNGFTNFSALTISWSAALTSSAVFLIRVCNSPRTASMAFSFSILTLRRRSPICIWRAMPTEHLTKWKLSKLTPFVPSSTAISHNLSSIVGTALNLNSPWAYADTSVRERSLSLSLSYLANAASSLAVFSFAAALFSALVLKLDNEAEAPSKVRLVSVNLVIRVAKSFRLASSGDSSSVSSSAATEPSASPSFFPASSGLAMAFAVVVVPPGP
mmetsp:Transcript_83637/g.210797  ORF Transcript_83637/g.210797 Transcript_83637/m.210797 type:complete len:252 (-) Transcript_83637:1072-1827(-)